MHEADYLRSLKRRETLAGVLEIPTVRRLPSWFVDWRVPSSMRFATGGTILACRLALERGIAVNLGGGFHHAAAGHGGGFYVYADIPIAAQILRDERKAERILVVDLDAHQGNGTASAFRGSDWARIFDVYEDDLFPHRKEPVDYAVPIPADMSGADYLSIVRDALPIILDDYRPDLLIYNAGSDSFEGGPLTRLRLSEADLVDWDLLVSTEARERGVPVAMVLSGGYCPRSWKIHAEAIEALAARFDRA